MGEDFEHRPAKRGLSCPRGSGDNEQQSLFLHFHFYFTAEHAEIAEKYMKLKIKFFPFFWILTLDDLVKSQESCHSCESRNSFFNELRRFSIPAYAGRLFKRSSLFGC
jgi:hypothetical protein